MIRINLLTERRKKKTPYLSTLLVPGVAIIVITLLALGVVTLRLVSKVSNMKDEKAVKEKKLSGLKVLLKEVENYEKDNQSYKEKNMIIEQLKKKQNVPLILLDEVSVKLPQGVWLTSLTDKEGDIRIAGYAFTNSDLVVYVQNLKSSIYLADVTLLESRQTELGNVSLYKFQLNFRVKV